MVTISKRNKGWFAPGRSGNPAGRTPGSRNRKTVFAEDLCSDDPAKVQAVIDRALAGDSAAAVACLDALRVPRRRQPDPPADSLIGTGGAGGAPR
jgi:hypothetical protein